MGVSAGSPLLQTAIRRSLGSGETTIVKISLMQLAIPTLVAVVVTAVLGIVRISLLRLANRWADNTQTRVDDIMVESVRFPSLYWCTAIGLYIGADISDLPGGCAH